MKPKKQPPCCDNNLLYHSQTCPNYCGFCKKFIGKGKSHLCWPTQPKDEEVNNWEEDMIKDLASTPTFTAARAKLRILCAKIREDERIRAVKIVEEIKLTPYHSILTDLVNDVDLAKIISEAAKGESDLCFIELEDLKKIAQTKLLNSEK